MFVEQSIDQFPSLAPFQHKLKILGLDTLERLLGAAHVSRRELEAFLGVSIDTILTLVPAAPSQIPLAAAKAILDEGFELGVNIESIQPTEVGFHLPIATAAALPTQVNHIPLLPPVRNQQARGTCVAFGTLAAYEHYLALNGALQDLSEQFLYWNAKQNDGIPNNSGTWVGVAAPLLQRDGVCLETTWPYNPTEAPNNEGQGPPPAGARRQALTYRPTRVNRLAPTSVTDLKTELARGRCIAFSVPVFNSWYSSQVVAYTGDITMPIPGELRVGGHAMCLVGYMDMPNSDPIGGGRFLLRNSWGPGWGPNSPHGAGYGTIPYAYLARYCTEAYSIDLTAFPNEVLYGHVSPEIRFAPSNRISPCRSGAGGGRGPTRSSSAAPIRGSHIARASLSRDPVSSTERHRLERPPCRQPRSSARSAPRYLTYGPPFTPGMKKLHTCQRGD